MTSDICDEAVTQKKISILLDAADFFEPWIAKQVDVGFLQHWNWISCLKDSLLPGGDINLSPLKIMVINFSFWVLHSSCYSQVVSLTNFSNDTDMEGSDRSPLFEKRLNLNKIHMYVDNWFHLLKISLQPYKWHFRSLPKILQIGFLSW